MALDHKLILDNQSPLIVFREFPLENDSIFVHQERSFPVFEVKDSAGRQIVQFDVGSVAWTVSFSGVDLGDLRDDRGVARDYFDLLDLAELAEDVGWPLALLSDGAIPWLPTLAEFRQQFPTRN